MLLRRLRTAPPTYPKALLLWRGPRLGPRCVWQPPLSLRASWRAGPLLERAAARICKEAGARLASHVALRDLNLGVPASDGCRIASPFGRGPNFVLLMDLLTNVRSSAVPVHKPEGKGCGRRSRSRHGDTPGAGKASRRGCGSEVVAPR